MTGPTTKGDECMKSELQEWQQVDNPFDQKSVLFEKKPMEFKAFKVDKALLDFQGAVKEFQEAAAKLPSSPETSSSSITGASTPVVANGAATTEASSGSTAKRTRSPKKKPKGKKPPSASDGSHIDTISPAQSPSFKIGLGSAGIDTTLSSSKNAKKRRPVKKMTAKMLCYSDINGNYVSKNIAIGPDSGVECRVETKAGYLQLHVEDEGGDLKFALRHMQRGSLAKYDPKWKSKIASGTIGVAGYKSVNKTAKARIKELEDSIRQITRIVDCFTGEAYDSQGKPKGAYHSGTKAPAWLLFDPLVKDLYKKGMPLHCKCGLHKTKNGQFTCKDLHEALESAKGQVAL